MTTPDMMCEWAGRNDHAADREVWEGRPNWTDEQRGRGWRPMCAEHTALAASGLYVDPVGDGWAVKVRALGGAR